MKKVLVTGSSGFIGSHVLNHFINCGYETYGWDVYANDIKEKQIDLTNAESVNSELKILLPDIIIHCAGNANVNDSVIDPDNDYIKNVIVTQNLLTSVNKINKKPRIVFLSSAAVYGNQDKLPINEEAILNPLSPYAKNKILCEELCKKTNENGGDIKIARIFSVYGNGLRKQIFWDMYQKIKKERKLEMFGTGEESRDYIHINDLLNAIYLLATTDDTNVVYNVANGEETTIKEVANIFATINNIENVSFNGIEMKGNPLNWRADISRIRKIGYKKTINIYDGIKNYSDWVKNIQS